jgi:hypothetical protein
MYQLSENGLFVDRLNNGETEATPVGSVTSIKCDLENTDYQQYLAWLAEGNQPLPPDAPAEGAN